jgi:ATP-dependent DNA helicase RecG
MRIGHTLLVIFLLIPLSFRKRPDKLGPSRDQVTAQVTAQVLNFCQEPRKSSEIMELIGLKHWKIFQANYLKPLLRQGLLAMTIPEKPTSSKQRYITTEAGNEVLKT